MFSRNFDLTIGTVNECIMSSTSPVTLDLIFDIKNFQRLQKMCILQKNVYFAAVCNQGHNTVKRKAFRPHYYQSFPRSTS